MGFHRGRPAKAEVWNLVPEGLKGGRGVKPGEFSSVQSLSHVLVFVTPWTAACHPCPWPTPGVCSNSCPSVQWCHPTISSSIVPFSSCRQSFPGSGSFPMSHFFSSRREWQITSVFLPWESHKQYEKGKKPGEEERKLKLFSYIGSDDL